ncbi:MAG: MurR/RpiR family transcriptional regulator [Kurthia sp.]|nr:MurR/RpiR family transcriptional regulator [Candidatus Kurthia equi]
MPQITFRTIHSNYSRLSDKEKIIADYILENPQLIIHATISEIAEKLEIADATVFRFCKRIGFGGFQEMKIALAADLAKPSLPVYDEITEADDVHTVAAKVFRSNIQTLENTLTLLKPQAIKQAASLLLDAEHIYFFGTGGSAVVAMDAYHKFMRTGKDCFAFFDSHFQLMAASQMKSTDVAMIISHSGTNKDTCNILRTVEESGAQSIAITAFPKSTIAQLATTTLLTTSEETEYRSEALSSRIAQLSLIDALYVNIMIHNKEASKKALTQIRNAISKTRS